MTRKKQNTKKQKENIISEAELEKAEDIIGMQMSSCCADIYEVLCKYRLTPAMLAGCLESVKTSIFEEVRDSAPAHICPSCAGKLSEGCTPLPKGNEESESKTISMYV